MRSRSSHSAQQLSHELYISSVHPQDLQNGVAFEFLRAKVIIRRSLSPLSFFSSLTTPRDKPSQYFSHYNDLKMSDLTMVIYLD